MRHPTATSHRIHLDGPLVAICSDQDSKQNEIAVTIIIGIVSAITSLVLGFPAGLLVFILLEKFLTISLIRYFIPMKTKKIFLKIQEPSINKIVGNKFDLVIQEKADVIDVIKEVDKTIRSKGGFPSKHYHSILHWIYNPIENRFYEQTGINAYTAKHEFLDIRNNPEMELPDGAMIILLPEGGCITAREDVLDYEKFQKAMSRHWTRKRAENCV